MNLSKHSFKFQALKFFTVTKYFYLVGMTGAFLYGLLTFFTKESSTTTDLIFILALGFSLVGLLSVAIQGFENFFDDFLLAIRLGIDRKSFAKSALRLSIILVILLSFILTALGHLTTRLYIDPPGIIASLSKFGVTLFTDNFPSLVINAISFSLLFTGVFNLCGYLIFKYKMLGIFLTAAILTLITLPGLNKFLTGFLGSVVIFSVISYLLYNLTQKLEEKV